MEQREILWKISQLTHHRPESIPKRLQKAKGLPSHRLGRPFAFW
jgi:hypothetical protein